MFTHALRKYLLAGLAVWLPIVVTLMVLGFIVDMLDKTIALLPQAYQPEHIFGFPIPGAGVIISLVILISTGVVATNILGQRLVSWGEAILARIPLVRSIYSATKQVFNAVFSTNSQAFRKVLLIEYPRKGIWSIAFLTGSEFSADDKSTPMYSVFIPTTPNPTSGFLLLVPQSDARAIDMSVDEALKYVISLGVMQPQSGTNSLSEK